MVSRFHNQMEERSSDILLLPLFHTCDVFDFRTYLETGIIEQEDICDVFSEKLTYFFYGRPAFKYKVEKRNTKNIMFYPVCFAVKINDTFPIKRLFPFDTGAMTNGLYRDHTHHKHTYLDFELEANTNSIKKIVLNFYNNNDGYLDGKKKNISTAPLSNEMFVYQQMIDAFTISKADERRATIEIQTETGVELNAENIIGLVCPTELLSDPTMMAFIDANGININPYDISVWDPSQYFAILNEKSKEIVKAWRELNE